MANEVELIKQRIDIADLIGEYVPLKSTGANLRALCPFHQEKTPSFFVSRDRQTWRCFGCGEGGDLFSFIQKMEGLEFVDALKLLAKKANIELSGTYKRAVTHDSRVVDALALGMKFYHKVLLESHEAEIARTYLAKRGLDALTMDAFDLGYAPESWDKLLNVLTKKGYAVTDLVRAGLVTTNDTGRTYDRFRGRIIFPIRDEHGRVVGCTGRTLREEADAAKYVNTPQTELFDKGRLLYALDRAKHAIRKSGVAILMEGQMDVIAAHQFGFTNVIAASGTALTDAQVKLLKRYAKQAIFAFDVDQAGVEAARRAIAIARRFELDVRIATMPHGKDPDECIREDKDAFQHAITSAAPAMEFFMQLATNNLDRTDVEAKKRAAKMVLPEIAMLTNPVEQAHYIQRLGFDVGVDEKTLHDAVKKVRVARPRVAAPSTTTGSPIAIEEYILAAFFLHPELIGTYMPTFDSNALSETMRDLYTQMVSLYSSGHKDSASFQPALESLSDQHEVLDRLRFLSDELRENFSESELSLELHEWIATRSRAMLQRELANLQTQIRQLEGSPSDNQSTQLQALTERYASRLARLKQFES